MVAKASEDLDERNKKSSTCRIPDIPAPLDRLRSAQDSIRFHNAALPKGALRTGFKSKVGQSVVIHVYPDPDDLSRVEVYLPGIPVIGELKSTGRRSVGEGSPLWEPTTKHPKSAMKSPRPLYSLAPDELSQCRAWRNAKMLEAELIRKGDLTENHAQALGYPIVILPDGSAFPSCPVTNQPTSTRLPRRSSSP